MTIVFESGKVRFDIVLNDSKSANEIFEKLPISSRTERWGDEIYFEIPVKCLQQSLTLDVSVGDVAYWPEGSCFCIFFGPTPASKDQNPKPASGVALIGHTTAEPSVLRTVASGVKVTLARKK